MLQQFVLNWSEEHLATPFYLIQQLIHSPTVLSTEIKSQIMSKGDWKKGFDIFYRF